MQDQFQTARLIVTFLNDRANYKGTTQTWVIIGKCTVICCLIHDRCYRQQLT